MLRRATQQVANRIWVLIFDPFEEVLTLAPADRGSQEVFFQELGAILADGTIWALFSMREDYVGGLDPFVRYLPDRLRMTYRLDLLGPSEAMVAMQRPAVENGVYFADAAAAKLLDRLAALKVQRLGSGGEKGQVFRVIPFQLQVMCRRLWKSMAEEKGVFYRIEVDDLGSCGEIATAVHDYYGDTLREVARTTGAEEPVIREWFEKQLINAQHLRGQTQFGPPVSREVDLGKVLRALEDSYLVHSYTRAGATWYELSHDNLIEPILESNEMVRRRPQRPSRWWRRLPRR